MVLTSFVEVGCIQNISNLYFHQNPSQPGRQSIQVSQHSINIGITPPIAEILCVKNGKVIVVLWFLNEIIKKIYTESLKKIVGAVWELPAK